MMKLFLDDTRDPADVYRSDDWVVVRSVAEFKRRIQEHGAPDIISFDHDLGADEPNGMQAAKWLVENEVMIREFRVHSANIVGRGNIESYLQQWMAVRKCGEGGERKG